MHNNLSNKPSQNINPNIILQKLKKKKKKKQLKEFIDFQDFPGPALIFQDFPVLENARIIFQGFLGFP